MKTLSLVLIALAGAASPKVAPMEVPQLGALPIPLLADVPPTAQPNQGAPGFNAEGDAIEVEIQPAPADGPTSLPAAKKEAEGLPFSSWIDSRKTADGWVLTYVAPGMDMEGNTVAKYLFSVRRTLAGKPYNCYGGLKKKAWLDANVKICASLRAK